MRSSDGITRSLPQSTGECGSNPLTIRPPHGLIAAPDEGNRHVLKRGRDVQKAEQGLRAMRTPGRSKLRLSGSLFFQCGKSSSGQPITGWQRSITATADLMTRSKAMNVDTGEIHHFDEEEFQRMHFESLSDLSERMVDMERKMVSLSDDEAAELEKQPAKKRKGWMRNQPCVCGSGKKFKKCCWSQFK